MTKIVFLKGYFWFLGVFTLFWWPLSHWFYPDWYHQLMGFTSYDYALVKIIGTIGVVPVLGMFFAAANPIRNRDFVLILMVFFILLSATYVFLINFHGFPKQEYFNVGLLMANTVITGILFPWRKA